MLDAVCGVVYHCEKCDTIQHEKCITFTKEHDMKKQRFTVALSADEVERIIAVRGQQRDSASNMLAKLIIKQVEHLERCQRGEFRKTQANGNEQPAWADQPDDPPSVGKPSFANLQAKINSMQTRGETILDRTSNQESR